MEKKNLVPDVNGNETLETYKNEVHKGYIKMENMKSI